MDCFYEVKKMGETVDQILRKWNNYIVNVFFDDINDNVSSIKK